MKEFSVHLHVHIKVPTKSVNSIQYFTYRPTCRLPTDLIGYLCQPQEGLQFDGEGRHVGSKAAAGRDVQDDHIATEGAPSEPGKRQERNLCYHDIFYIR